jgi:UDP-N-acetylglucosamine--N-acetylmuramyl-(pentapeptide) pyrophosphoryl-undecaprenol N-acetylglucosamine transferase
LLANDTSILIMAAGTGGHVFPALAIAQELSAQGVTIEWLGTPAGMENELLANTGIRIHPISVKGLAGGGIARIMTAPFMIAIAVFQSMRVINRLKPACVLGMGGFVSGPGGVATKIMGRRLVIHEQNAVAGITNKILARIADRVLEAFPDTFDIGSRVMHTGNPVRADITSLNKSFDDVVTSKRPLRLLILGGSQGAAVLNDVIPELLEKGDLTHALEIWHQTGKLSLSQTRGKYQSIESELLATCRVDAFIDDMAAAYAWADLVLCRSGASTVSELAVAGMASILVPYPHHADNQQLRNAQWLSRADAALIVEQSELSATALSHIIADLDRNRDKLRTMSQQARTLAIANAGELIAAQCLEVAGV